MIDGKIAKKGSRFKFPFLRILQLFVSVSLLAWVASNIDFSDVGYHLTHVHPIFWWVVPIALASRWLMSAKWVMLLRASGAEISGWTGFRIYTIASCLGLVLPATVGADVSRAALAYREGYSVSDVSSSIVVERLLGFTALTMIALFGLVVLGSDFAGVDFDRRELLLTITVVFATFIGGFFLSFNATFSRFLLRLLDGYSPNHPIINRIKVWLAETYRSYLRYASKRMVLLWFYLLSCIEVFVYVTVAYVIALSLGINESYTYFVAFVAILSFFIRLPISIGGLGIYEMGVEFFLLQVGVPAALGLSVGILFNLVSKLDMLIPGAIILAFTRLKPAAKTV